MDPMSIKIKKTIKSYWLLLTVIIMAGIVFFFFLGKFKQTAKYCQLRNGRISSDIGIVSESDGYPIYKTICQNHETNIGKVTDSLCDCVCCVPN